eukprot:COSAG04_NODE_6392_length_1340_cov_0.749396_1_plen_190_part_00
MSGAAKNWGKIKNAAKVAAKAGAAAAGQKAKKAVHKAIGIETIEEEEDEDWPEWKRTMLVDPGDSVKQVIAALPELVKPREPFDIFRAKTIKKLHERNPTMEYAFLKETAEQMWEVLFENEKEVYVQISEKQKEEHQQQPEHREVLDYALNTLGQQAFTCRQRTYPPRLHCGARAAAQSAPPWRPCGRR